MLTRRSDKTPLFEKVLAILNLASDGEYRVLDFGCGTGDFLGLLSQRVNDKCELFGLDAMERSIEQARSRNSGITFVCEHFTNKLSFPDDWFDTIVTIDALECIKDKSALIDEFHRTLKPGGKMLAAHWDCDTQTYDTDRKDIARKAMIAYSDWKQPWMDECDGQMGRKLWRLFEGSSKFKGKPDAFSLLETTYEEGRYGFELLQDLVSLVDKGPLNKEEYALLCRELREKAASGRYFYSMTSFIYYGEKA